LLLSGCGGRLPTIGPAPTAAAASPTPGVGLGPAVTGCLDLGQDPVLSLPAPGVIAELAAGASPPAVSSQSSLPPYFLHVPPAPPLDRPLQVLVALHGFGGRGQAFATAFLPLVDANGWILVAPTFDYVSLADPVATRDADLRVAEQLSAILADVPRRSGRATRDRALLLGFSRGASMAARFALLHPERVQAVAALSGGAYTVPQSCVVKDRAEAQLPLPLGTADLERRAGRPLDGGALRRIPFWLSVGSLDNRADQLPSTYDDVLGRTRLERGVTFDRSLAAFGVRSRFTIFPDVGHAVSDAMVRSAGAFLTNAAGPAPASNAP
jgi:predicted esterase